MKRLIPIAYSLFLIIVLLLPGLIYKGDIVVPESLKSKTQAFLNQSIAVTQQVVASYSVSEINQGIQSVRQKIGLTALIVDEKMCESSQVIFQKYESEGALSKEDLVVFCPECDQKAYLTIEGNYKLPGQASWMESGDVTTLVEQEYTHLCSYTGRSKALILLGDREKGSKVSNVESSPVSKNFTEDQLWQALVDYRHAHTKPDLLKSDSLCTYARKRVAEHISMYAVKPKEAYRNQDKYPLDAHEGFEVDGNSGYVFDVTGFNVVAENLAYWPSAEYPNQVIEWGWDTSTEGHKEAQLSDEYTHACLVGENGFYVAIFARN